MSNDYVKYQHVEKLGNTEVDGVLLGDVYVFPKIDGTNAHVWYDVEEAQHYYGSRNRVLSLENDNAGFMNWASEQYDLKDMAAAIGGVHVYGEWLVPHSLKTYRDDAWRQFYVFDMAYKDDDGNVKHYHYDKVAELCERYNVNYIAPLRIIHNPQYDDILKVTDENHYLIKEGEGVGEGVVLKNYEFVNKYGRQTWGKVVTTEFKEKHIKAMGAPESNGTAYVEDEIIERFLTADIVDKVQAKIVTECEGWSSKYIARLLQTVMYDLIREHSWDIVKAFKMPTINYKLLNKFAVIKIKKYKPELF